MTTTSKTASAPLPNRLSPELVEVLHMLKALESQPVPSPAAAANR
jgi:hypothetical protein